MHKTLRWTIVIAALLGVNAASAQVGLLEIYRLAEVSDPVLRQAEANCSTRIRLIEPITSGSASS